MAHMRPAPHIPDEDLIRALDGELGEPRAAEVDRHLHQCWDCRSRRDRLEAAVTAYMPVHHEIAEIETPPAAGPAAQLRAGLRAEDEAQPEPMRRWRWVWARATPALVMGSLALLLTPVAMVVWFSAGKAEAAGPLPDARLTPGAVRFISKQQVCVVPSEDEARLVPPELAAHVFERYRIASPKPKTYEVDYLISPALGGATAIQNLWPVPYAEGAWTSRVKDALEDRLRTLVCEGKIDLATAQREISTNWIAAYRKYFKTKRPVAAHALFVKDSPWE